MRKPTTRVNLTKKYVESLSAPATNRLTIYDTNTPSLGLRVEPTGARSFFWFKKIRSRPTFKALGRFPDLSINQARGKAAELSAKLAKWKSDNFEGSNPLEKPKGELTFGELVEQYVARHVRAHAKRPERAEQNVRWIVNSNLKDFKTYKVGTIQRTDVARLHGEVGKEHGPYLANRVVEVIRSIYYWSASEGVELYDGPNPAAKLKRFHEEKRRRFVQPDELPRLFAALREDTPDMRDYVNLSLWTGARRSDVLAMRWGDLSIADNRWTVPDPKNREPYIVALTPEAVKILKDRLRQRSDENPWVFPSFGESGHLVDLKGRWKALLKRAKIDNLRQHDLRRTLGSWQAAQGASLQIIGASLGHKSVAATQIYSQLNLDPVRASVTAATKAMIAASRKKPKLLKAATA